MSSVWGLLVFVGFLVVGGLGFLGGERDCLFLLVCFSLVFLFVGFWCFIQDVNLLEVSYASQVPCLFNVSDLFNC